MRARRTDNPDLSRDYLCRMVFAVDGLRGHDHSPEHLTDLINAIVSGSSDDIEREIKTLSIQAAPVEIPG